MTAWGLEPQTHGLKICCSTNWAKRSWWSIVSHIIPYYFNSWGTGSHLYTANANTLRSVHRVEVLLALVGTHILWSPRPPLLCFYYSTLLAICQALFFWNPSFIFSAFAYTSCCRGLQAICSVGSFAPLWKNWETPHGIGLFRRNPLELLLCLYYNTVEMVCQDPFWIFSKRFFQPLVHLDFLTHSTGFCCEFYQPSRLYALIIS